MSFMGLFSGKAKDGEARSARTASAEAGSLTAALSDAEKVELLEELESSGLGWFWSTDVEGNVSYLSRAISQRIGLGDEPIIGAPLSSLFNVEATEGRGKSIALKLGARKGFANLLVKPAKGEANVVLSLSGRPIISRNGDFRGFRGTATDITEQHTREEETARLAKFDSLTGLANRHRMAQLMDSTLTAFQAAKRHCAVMMLDLDRFKQVNDTLGHAAGDELLKEVASRLNRVVDSHGTVARLGGDEFQVMIPDMEDRGALGELAMKIITILTQPYSLEDGRCAIGASVGIAIAPFDGVTRDEIVRAADLALYSAKNGGRGQFRFYSADLENEAIFRRRLENDLQDAVRGDQLFLEFQPVVSHEEVVTSLEALVCWDHPERGYIDSEEFQSIVDGSSLQAEIGAWAIAKACEEAQQWPESLHVAVNVPASQFTANTFVETVESALEESGLSPARLELEVKESVFLGDSAVTTKTLDALFKLGVRLSLDEFGTGFSSLEYLRRTPFDTIKIGDNFFEGRLEKDSRAVSLISAIVALAKALDMKTVAVGVESMELLKALRGCGVSCIQGPIYAHPVPAGEVLLELQSGSWSIKPAGPRTQRAKRRTVFRKIQVIHDDYSYDVTMRNLSRTGALIQGLADVPVGTQFVVDLGAGQLAVASVSRTNGDTQGLEFETPLVDDGAGGLCTRHRVSPYALAAAGAPLAALTAGNYQGMQGGLLDGAGSIPKFGYSTAAKSEAA